MGCLGFSPARIDVTSVGTTEVVLAISGEHRHCDCAAHVDDIASIVSSDMQRLALGPTERAFIGAAGISRSLFGERSLRADDAEIVLCVAHKVFAVAYLDKLCQIETT